MAVLDHPTILKFIGYSQTEFNGDPSPTIVTEYASNGSLHDILEMEKNGLSPIGFEFYQEAHHCLWNCEWKVVPAFT
ncbi:hypothetical protein M9Y10_018356 [Tritrichomonas musculus]|uniref:Protein kinase domain-containing protein n=1 Tax=Tritrichomonas musculus TaxID=1915356 RepID=A0ABR2HNC9_9EUKA